MEIAVDFDGTCVTHEYPAVGKDIGAARVLKRLVDNGHELILFTMRSGAGVDDAVQWFKDNDIPLFGIQKNPEQHLWTSSPKAYAQLYIDDAALGCPLVMDLEFSEKPFVDWARVEFILEETGFLDVNFLNNNYTDYKHTI